MLRHIQELCILRWNAYGHPFLCAFCLLQLSVSQLAGRTPCAIIDVVADPCGVAYRGIQSVGGAAVLKHTGGLLIVWEATPLSTPGSL